VNRPLIGVTGDETHLPLAWWFIRWALWHCGAVAYRLTPQRCVIPQNLNGIIISGGDDIDQRLYMPDTHDKAPINPKRDRFELIALDYSLSRKLPVLGICSGAQLLNVPLGGKLHIDLLEQRRLTSHNSMLLPRKTLFIEKDSKLQKKLGSPQGKTNSLHHQTVKDLGEGLDVAARDAGQIIQAMEDPRQACRIGVQWHPEYLPQQLRLFKHLVGCSQA
jgi:putative glutamine amidotransferase